MFLAEHSLDRLVSLAETDITDVRDAARLLTDAENVVIVWGERLGHGERGPEALRALRDLALLAGARRCRRIRADRDPGGGQRARPARDGLPARHRSGLCRGALRHERRAGAQRRPGAGGEGVLSPALGPDAHPSRQSALGRGARIRRSWSRTSSSSPSRSRATPTSSSRPRPTPEKEGTVTHPDGRVQRLRPAVGHPGEVRSEWRVLVELAPAPRPRSGCPRERQCRLRRDRRARRSLHRA